MIKSFITLLAFVLSQRAVIAQTRTVNVTWTASVSAGVTGYTIFTSTSATGTFTFKGCTGTVPNQTCVPGSTASTTTFADSETIGTTVFYEISAVSPPCTNTTPTTTTCGTSVPANASTTVPPQPSISTVVLVVP